MVWFLAQQQPCVNRRLEKYGRFYLTQVHIGGLRTYASGDERKFSKFSTERTTEYQNTLKVAKAPVKLGSKFINSTKEAESKLSNTSEINGTTLGGTPKNFASDRETVDCINCER